MTRPFTFRINAAELYSEIMPLTQKQRGEWITAFCSDLITLKPVLFYSESVIQEAIDFIDKKKRAGLLGGRPKKAQVKHRLSTAKAHPNPEAVTEAVTETKKEIYKSILADLNVKGGFRYTANAATISLINGRLSEGHTAEDFFFVHTNMIAKWKDDEKMRQYIRPATLYQASKFEGYLHTTVQVPKLPGIEEWQ